MFVLLLLFALEIEPAFIDSEDFYEITAVAVDARERIYLVDGGERTVWVHDRQGRFIRRIGRGGQGPGEFQRPRDVAFLDDERILVSDADQQKLHVFSAEGDYQKSLVIGGQPLGSVIPMPDGSLVVTRSAGTFFVIGKTEPTGGRFGRYDLEGKHLGWIGDRVDHENPLLAGVMNGGSVDLMAGVLVLAPLTSPELVFFEDGTSRSVRYPIAFAPREPKEEMVTRENDDGTTSISMSVVMDMVCPAMAVRNDDEILLLRAVGSTVAQEDNPQQLILVGRDGKIRKQWPREFRAVDLAVSRDGRHAYVIDDQEQGRVVSRVTLP